MSLTAVDGERILVNCASQEYWKSVRPKNLPDSIRIITCDFPGPAVYAKKARGMMCRFMVKTRAKTVEDLKGFQGEGDDKYSFSAAKSTSSKLVFIRDASGAGAKAASGGAAKKRPAAADADDKPSKRGRA